MKALQSTLLMEFLASLLLAGWLRLVSLRVCKSDDIYTKYLLNDEIVGCAEPQEHLNLKPLFNFSFALLVNEALISISVQY